MSLGLCCQWLESTPKGLKNILVSRSLQLSRLKRGEYSNEKIHKTYLDNIINLRAVFPKIISSGIKSFRVSSALFPLWDLVDRSLWDDKKIIHELKSIGDLAKTNYIRITTHPGQFCVLSSNSKDIIDKSIKEIEMHAWVMDMMGLDINPHYSINIHGGKADAADVLISSIRKLNPSAKSRLTLENCEFAYTINDLAYVSKETEVPLVFDSHHHSFNPGGMGGKSAMELAMSTWPSNIKPLTHVSSSKPEYLSRNFPVTKLREHSDMLHTCPDYQIDANNRGAIDIDIEAKNKNHALFESVEKFGLVL